MYSLNYIELHLPICEHTWTVAPCSAIDDRPSGQTFNDNACFNTLTTCRDLANYSPQPVVVRFAESTDNLPLDIPAIPSVRSISHTPARAAVGSGVGQRATLKVQFTDHKWPDMGPAFDQNIAHRSYSETAQGTIWGRLRSRHASLRGATLVWRQGEVGQTLGDMRVKTFLIESFTGPTQEGLFTIIAHDPLRMLNADRAQCPPLSQGRLLATLTATATTAVLSPTGIGDSYATSGLLAIGGAEIVSYTRSGDTLTFSRGALNTTPDIHDAESRVQQVAVFQAVSPATLLHDLLTNYAGVPDEYIPLAEWEDEVATHLQVLYSGYVADPTDVYTLVSELVEQAALSIWWDEDNTLIRLRVLKPVPTDVPLYNEDRILQGTLRVDDQPALGKSQVWVYYGQRNPLRPVTDPDNYTSALLALDEEAERAAGSAQIHRIYARWIPALGRAVAERAANLQVARFSRAPRRVVFETTDDVLTGDLVRVADVSLQTETGARDALPIQLTRVGRRDGKTTVEGVEMRFSDVGAIDTTDRVIYVNSNTRNFNALSAHNLLYPEITAADVAAGVNLSIVVSEGVYIGSVNALISAFTVGGFPSGLPINISLNGFILGAGGQGGFVSGAFAYPGQRGGTALHLTQPVTIDYGPNSLVIGGGGGGAAVTARLDSAVYGTLGRLSAAGGGGSGFNGGPSGFANITIGTSNGTFTGTAPTGAGLFIGGSGGTNQFYRDISPHFRSRYNDTTLVVGGRGGGGGLPGGASSDSYIVHSTALQRDELNITYSRGAVGGAGFAVVGNAFIASHTGTPDLRGLIA